MDFELSAEQELFWTTTKKFLDAECPIPTVRALADDPVGFDAAWWQRGAALGWTSAFVPAEFGGGSVSGRPVLDLVIVAEEFGRHVGPGPLLPTNVVAAAIAAAGTDDQRTAVLPALASGEQVAAWAFAEPGRAWRPRDVALQAERAGDTWVLDGEKAYVEAAAQAAWLLVTARGPDGLIQFLVPADAEGIIVTPVESLDLVRRFGHVRFDRARVPASSVLGDERDAGADVEYQLQLALAVQCAEMVGAIDRVFEFTVQWAFDRYSFGRPLASYQALKHRFADMKMWLEACHGTATAAARAVDGGAADASELVSVAKAYIGDQAPELVQDCVQLHGGIGITWEHDIHLYLRRVTQDRSLYGAPAQHRDRVAALLGMGG
ncbi:MAG TPA: acyl-CoA dehydrogenase family protein [Acidimicrobiales bacterium]|nr:acyl-CoA dehydrogenase family protein [Acidimicrobiales bacterium]